MIVTELVPKPHDKLQFKLLCYKSVPQISGCYVLTTFANEILYIGLALNLNSRFQQHLDNKQKTMGTKYGKAIWFYYLAYDSRNLPKLERSWLNQYTTVHSHLPILNRINSPIT